MREALVAICREQGVAEWAEWRTAQEARAMFLLTTRFRKALEVDTFLVVGDRGAGKTMLFRILAEEGGGALLDSNRSTCVGFARRSGDYEQPSVEALGETLLGGDTAHHRQLWLALLGRTLREDLHGIGASLYKSLQSSDPAALLQVARIHATELDRALNELDARLHGQAETRFVLYDDLDLFVPTWNGLFPALRGLFSLWQTSTRTWRRLRPKIFLRKDLFESELLAFPDGAKFFAARMITLTWGREDLFALVAKRLLNWEHPQDVAHRKLHSWLVDLCGGEGNLSRSEPSLGVSLRERQHLGSRLMEALVGARVGEGVTASPAEDWVVQHITDGTGEASPRSLLRLLRGAAERALDELQPPVCVPPRCLQGAQSDVSKQRLAELRDEDEWLDDLKAQLDGASTPITREELVSRVTPLIHRPRVPCQDLEELVERLTKRGVFIRRTDDRFDVPELYRLGLGLDRNAVQEPVAWPAPSLEVRELLDRLFCVREAPYGPFTRTEQDLQTLLPGILYRVRLVDSEFSPVTLQLYRGLDSVGGALWSREARALMRLSTRWHPALPRVRSGGYVDHEDVAFIVTDSATYTLAEPNAMEFIGKEPVEALRQLVMLCQGLSRLHEQGVVHRNLNPETIEYLEAHEGSEPRGYQLRLSRFEMSTMLGNLLRGAGAHAVEERRIRDMFLRDLEQWLAYSPPERLEWLLAIQDTGGDWPESDREDVYPLGVLAVRWLVEPRLGNQLMELWAPAEPSLERARYIRARLVSEVQRSGLPTELRELLRGMLEETPVRRLPIAEVLRRLSEHYGALSSALSDAKSDARYFVGFMPEESHKTLLKWGWIDKDPNEPAGREELRQFLLQELECADLLYSPDGFLPFKPARDDKERRSFRAARYVLRGRQGYWFCDLYVPPGPSFRDNPVQLDELLLIKYVCHHRFAWRLEEVDLRRPVPGRVDFIPVWSSRAPDLESVRKQATSWRSLMRSVERSDTRPAWRMNMEDALLFLLALRRAQLDARCFPVQIERGVDGEYTLTRDALRDRKRQYADPLRALYFRELREPMGRLFRTNDAETGKVQVLTEKESGQPDYSRPVVAFLLDVQDDDTIVVKHAGAGARMPESGWVRPEEDQGDAAQLRRQAEATETLRRMGGLLEQLYDPRTLRGAASRWRGVGRKLKGRGGEIVKEMLATEPFYALHGPPGTGKTTITAIALAAALQQDAGARVLVSSQSHYALDNLGTRVLKEVRGARRGEDAYDLVALRVASKEALAQQKIGMEAYLPERQTAQRIEAIQRQVTRTIAEGRLTDGQPLSPELRGLLARWSEMAPRVGLEIRDRLRRGANLVFATTGACTEQNLGLSDASGVFDWVIVEEAARAWPTELAMPMVMGRRWTLIGDHLQLPAFDEMTVDRVLQLCARSDDDELRLHAVRAQDYRRTYRLFGNLFDRRAERAQQRSASARLTEPLNELDWQFRMHPHIARVVSRAFYRTRIDPQTGTEVVHREGWLRSDESTNERAHNVSAPRFLQRRALVWLDTDGCDDNDDRRTWYNEGEARVVAQLLARLRPAPAEHDEDRFALLTPYLQQAEALRKAHLPEWALPHLHTVDSFQGREADIVVVSLVRSVPRGRGLEEARPEMEVGYLVSPNRVNVLFSRARALLVVVGKFEHFRDLCDRYPERQDIRFWREITAEVLAQGAVVSARSVLDGLEGV